MYITAANAAELKEKSFTQTVRIFKHSNACGTSFYAREAVDAFMEKSGCDVVLVVVQEDRALSDAIADTFGVRHQSPQYLVVKNGTADSLSHYGISVKVMENME